MDGIGGWWAGCNDDDDDNWVDNDGQTDVDTGDVIECTAAEAAAAAAILCEWL